MENMAYDAFASRFTVLGSSMSCLATLAVLLYCLACRARHASLRRALVVNLLLANCLSTLNTTVSGFIYVDVHSLHPGHACKANGFFALMTAQAIDFTILTIVVVTLLAVIRLVHLPTLSAWQTKLLICASTWTIPFATSSTALAMDALRPVDMNWCDMVATRPGLRYALARGWRLAILLLAMCLYAFIWWFVRKHHSLFSATADRKASRGGHTCSKTISSKIPTPAPSRSSTAHSSLQVASHRNRPAKGARCSEFSLPLQGYDFSGAEFQEREKAIDSRTERISRWIHVRHPGMINSISALKPPSQSRLLIPQIDPEPAFTRPSTAIMDRKSPGLSLPTFSPPCLPPTPGPNYHNQCPKVQKSFSISTVEKPEIAKMSSLVVEQRQSSEPRYRESDKSAKSAGARTQSSVDTVPWKICSGGRLPASVKWPFCDVSSSPMQPSSYASTSTASGEYSDSGPRRQGHCSKASGPSNVCVEHNDQSQDSSLAVESEKYQDSGRRNHSTVPPPQGPLALPKHRLEETQESSGSFPQDEMPAKHCLEGSLDRVQTDAVSRPNYHNQCPKVKHSFEVSVDSTQGIMPRPNYHNQCPKVTKTVVISPSGPTLPKVPSLTLRPDFGCTETTIVTTPMQPPPSPIPGLPPPPWSPGAKEQHRKTFLLSRSTWSDSTTSKNSPPVGDTAKNEREIRRTLLLNAYPLAYFVLSLPWMVNCFIEARGDTPQDQRAMHVLLGLPQYLGLVNAGIFAIDEFLKTMRRKIRIAEMGQGNDEKSPSDSECV